MYKSVQSLPHNAFRRFITGLYFEGAFALSDKHAQTIDRS